MTDKVFQNQLDDFCDSDFLQRIKRMTLDKWNSGGIDKEAYKDTFFPLLVCLASTI